jgi:hypothetical protein
VPRAVGPGHGLRPVELLPFNVMLPPIENRDPGDETDAEDA